VKTFIVHSASPALKPVMCPLFLLNTCKLHVGVAVLQRPRRKKKGRKKTVREKNVSGTVRLLSDLGPWGPFGPLNTRSAFIRNVGTLVCVIIRATMTTEAITIMMRVCYA
jgi:hypothetical protein